ncbi:Chorismate mutase 2 [Cucurbita argyrosperma subsp. argyrosperma]|uniref:Chorismate mutase n=2 Tax=Cucurbita moschata TaxID=3662 RepID=A0A6J1FHZ7_CUCMO|nr:chorismate mutase 2-like isoform X1 [Cucurbita moschata]XP_023524337.1 chorismate mutase 2 isoform X1 [Cucurbita pepo subsp. pepo]KAG7037650.1 Chorismate mutase 2 [Cucurbita argyrosperma subsp. argyrosperma]
MLFLGLFVLILAKEAMADVNCNPDLASNKLSLDEIRDSLIRQEDTIVFCLIERAKFPLNPKLYHRNHGFTGSLVEFIVRETEAIQAKAGRYENPEENAFFPEHLPRPLVHPRKYPKVLHPSGASINMNKPIWDFYFNKFLPLLVADGDDGNYAATAASDLACLQALSRRIHCGKYVAEVKFRDAPHEYEPPIRSQERDSLMKLLTFEAVEEMVKKRVEKKARVFGQEVTLNNTVDGGKYKIDPLLAARLYDEWVMPLTKEVEVEYLLRRLE